MKKYIYKFLCVGILAMGFASCDLDTEPTDKLPQEQLLSDIGGVEAILNGVYRSFYKTDWSEDIQPRISDLLLLLLREI